MLGQHLGCLSKGASEILRFWRFLPPFGLISARKALDPRESIRDTPTTEALCEVLSPRAVRLKPVYLRPRLLKHPSLVERPQDLHCLSLTSNVPNTY